MTTDRPTGEADLANEVALARQIAAGSEQAFTQFYERYADALYAFVYHHVGRSRADAEDVWQETLFSALNGIAYYRGDARLFTWLCGIARHKIADHLRRQKRSPAVAFADLSANHLAPLMATAPLEQGLIEDQATRVLVVEALGLLPDDYRTALVARYAGSQSVSEVAALLGRSYKATESLLSRARSAFRQTLARLEETE